MSLVILLVQLGFSKRVLHTGRQIHDPGRPQVLDIGRMRCYEGELLLPDYDTHHGAPAWA